MPSTRTEPGKGYRFEGDADDREDVTVAKMCFTVRTSVDQAKDILAEKPLRRPNRNRPIHSQLSLPSGV